MSVPVGQPLGNLGALSFRLDEFDQRFIREAISPGYAFRDAIHTDAWSYRVQAFKMGQETAIRGAMTLLPTICSQIRFGGRGPLIVCTALHSRATQSSPLDSLYRVGWYLVQQMNYVLTQPGYEQILRPWVFWPHMLTKSAHPSLSRSQMSRQKRRETVGGIYRASPELQHFGTDHVLVLDDVCTTGCTLSSIASAICAVRPGLQVTGLALGKAEKQGYARSQGIELTNDHIPAEWFRIWDNAGA